MISNILTFLSFIVIWCYSMPKNVEFYKPNLAIRKKMFIISLDPAKYRDYVMSL